MGKETTDEKQKKVTKQELTTNEFITSVEDSILDPNLDLSMDIADLTADALGLIGFPLWGFLVKAGKVAAKTILSAREDILLQKTYATAQAFNAKTIEPKKLEKYREKLKNPKFAREEMGRLIDLIDKSTEIKKCYIHANLFHHYVNEDITPTQYYELSETLNRMFTTDCAILIKAYSGDDVMKNEEERYRLDRLIAIGLIKNRNSDMHIEEGSLIFEEGGYKITLLGELLCKYGLKTQRE